MDDQVVWSPQAIDDGDAIAAYIARDSPAYAATTVDRILKTTRNLSNFPCSGRIVPEFNDPADSRKVCLQLPNDRPD